MPAAALRAWVEKFNAPTRSLRAVWPFVSWTVMQQCEPLHACTCSTCLHGGCSGGRGHDFARPLPFGLMSQDEWTSLAATSRRPSTVGDGGGLGTEGAPMYGGHAQTHSVPGGPSVCPLPSSGPRQGQDRKKAYKWTEWTEPPTAVTTCPYYILPYPAKQEQAAATAAVDLLQAASASDYVGLHTVIAIC